VLFFGVAAVLLLVPLGRDADGGDTAGGNAAGGDVVGGDATGGDATGGDAAGGAKNGEEVREPATSAAPAVAAAPAAAAATSTGQHDRPRLSVETPTSDGLVTSQSAAPMSPRRKAYIQSRPASSVGSSETLFSVLRLPIVPALATAYCLLKPCRSTLHFWLPYYMRTSLSYDDASVATCLMVYDLGSLLGGVSYSWTLDFLPLGQLFVPLALLLSLLLLALTTAAALGPSSFAVVLMLLGSTFGGLELMASGSAAGCIVDAVGGTSQGTLPAIVGAINGFGSFASMVGVSSVSALLDTFGWHGVFRAGACNACLAALVLLPTVRKSAKGESGAASPSSTSSTTRSDKPKVE